MSKSLKELLALSNQSNKRDFEAPIEVSEPLVDTEFDETEEIFDQYHELFKTPNKPHNGIFALEARKAEYSKISDLELSQQMIA